MEPQPHGQPVDEDLELALRLHRELNAVPRRQRQPARNQAASAALKTLTKKHQQHDSDSSSSESERSRGSGKRRASAPPSDNDSGSKRRRQQQEGGGRKPARSRSGARKPPHVVAANEARRKAAAASAAGVGVGGDAQPRTHVKCFFAGLPHGAWLAVEALASRASLAAAVSHAFRDDGVACSSEAATVVFVGADKQSHEFVGGQSAAAGDAPKHEAGQEGQAAAQQRGGAAGEDANKWRAAARTAVRVYVR